MTIIYQKPTKNYPPEEPKRYEVEWGMSGRWVHWSWHRYKWAARFEVFTGFEMMRIVDHHG